MGVRSMLKIRHWWYKLEMLTCTTGGLGLNPVGKLYSFIIAYAMPAGADLQDVPSAPNLVVRNIVLVCDLIDIVQTFCDGQHQQR